VARIRYKEALGLEAKRGKSPIGNKPDKEELERMYVSESKSIREIAGQLGCTKDMVYRTLREYRIDRRSNVSRSRLRLYNIRDLEKGIRAKGLRGYAKELGVHENTLRYYLKGVKEAK